MAETKGRGSESLEEDAPNTQKGGGGKAALALGIVALLLGAGALGLVLTKSGAPAARTLHYTIFVGERVIVTGINSTTGLVAPIDTAPADEEGLTGEYVRWEPDILVANAGDTIVLTIQNPRKTDHSFAIESAAGDFTGTTSSGTIQGRTNSGEPQGTEVTITFTAVKPGVYLFRCVTVFVDASNMCHPDHESIVGHIIVMG